MKRILTATALMSVVATGAFAATDYETTTINQYVPEVDVSTLSDTQVDALVGIAGSSDEADIETEMRAYLDTYPSPEPVTVTTTADAEPAIDPAYTDDASGYDATIAEYLPDVDLDTLSDEQKAQLVSIATSADEADIETEMRAYLMD